MLATSDPRIGSFSTRASAQPLVPGYSAEPNIDAVLGGGESLRRGHGGQTVALLQDLLNRSGATPPLVVDGAFGPLTEAAVERFRASRGASGNQVDGALLGAMMTEGNDGPIPPPLRKEPRSAPKYGAPAPAGSIPASELQRADEARRRPGPAANPRGEATKAAPNSGTDLGLPPRPEGASTGSEFLARTNGLSRADREEAILEEIKSGNIPDHLRQFKEVPVESTDKDGRSHTGTIRVLPDYLAIGSNEDHVQVPMTPRVAQAIADQTSTTLPTKKMVDEIHHSADVKLRPQPLPAGPQMMSNDYYARHDRMVDEQKAERGVVPGQLVSGNQKDLVISNRLTANPDKVAIYGWHQQSGKPIQGLSTIHEASYADYSHGTRLVGGTMVVDGVERPVAEVLADPNLAGLISDEGVIKNPRVPR